MRALSPLVRDTPFLSRALSSSVRNKPSPVRNKPSPVRNKPSPVGDKMTLDIEAVEVSPLLANGLTMVREKAASRHVRLVMGTSSDLGSIQADARKVKQILCNLLSNAVKITPDGGSVALDACRVSRAQVGRLSGPWKGRSLPSGPQRLHGVPPDPRHRQRSRHLARGAGATVQAVQPARQQPRAKVRGDGARADAGQELRRAPRRHGGGGECGG